MFTVVATGGTATPVTIQEFPRTVAVGTDRARTPAPDARLLLSPDDERVVRMSEFQQEIQIRLESATQSLHEAERDGDDYLAQIRLGEIESLTRLAQEHGAVA